MDAFKEKIGRLIRIVVTPEGLELKKTLLVSMGNFILLLTEMEIDSASPVSFMKKNLLHECKLRVRFLRVEAVDEITKKAYQGFGSTMNIIKKCIVRTQSKGIDAEDQQPFITEAAEGYLLGNDILPNSIRHTD